MEIEFVLHGLGGRVLATVERNDRPELVGSTADSRGFPMAKAIVDYPDRGYDSLMGWIQLVRSDDNLSGGKRFEIDPLAFLGELPHPFCWIGINPTLFDAPSRSPRRDLDWMAHSFLCVPEGEPIEARVLLGFAWGFTIRDEEITLVPPQVLRPPDWDGHREHLAATYPDWSFPRANQA
jgi:hypothetical protein